MKKFLIAIILITALVLGVSYFVGQASYKERSNTLADEYNMAEVVEAIKLIVADKETNADICAEIAENAIVGDSGDNEMTITFKPSNDDKAVYKFSDAVINNGKSLKDCNALYVKLASIFGDTIKIRSKKYQNSDYAISIRVDINDGMAEFEQINGQFSNNAD